MTLSSSKPTTNVLPPPPPKVVAQALKVTAVNIDWLAGDGSDRCYYRITSPALNMPLVLMQLSGSDAAALKSGGYDWINIATLLTELGITVPRVHCTMANHAALIIEDYGDQMLEGCVFDQLKRSDHAAIERLYIDCIGIIAKFLSIKPDASAIWCQRAFDSERFIWELNFFVQKYLTPIAGIEFTEAEKKQFAAEVSLLAHTLSTGSQYFVHRDFHSRNVMVSGDKLAIIDFQDARLGPASYDLVSLCFDSYVPFSPDFRSNLMGKALELFKTQLGANVSADVQTNWRAMLLQRQLKAIGSFGYLTMDKKRNNYLKYVDPALTTLEQQGVEDERWPFLSGELIRRMRLALDKNNYGR